MVVNGGQGVGISDAAEAAWNSAHQAVLDADGDISGALRASESEWQGSGADAMRTAFSPLAQWAVSAATTAAGTAGGVGDQAVLAMETRRLVADNAPPQNFLEYLHDQVGSWDGHTVYDDQAAAVDRLMTGYETSSVPNEERFDTWSVPPTVVVTPAGAGPSGPGGPGGGGVGSMQDTGGLAPAGGGGIASALAQGGGAQPGGGGSPGVGGVAPGPVPPGGGAGALPGIAGSVPGAGGMGTGGAGSAGAGSAGAGTSGSRGAGAGVPGPGGAVAGPTGSGVPGSAGAGAGRSGVGGSGPAGSGSGVPGTGGRGLGTGGVAHPSERPLGSRGGSGTGPGPWSRTATGSGGSPAGAAPFRSVVPAMPPRTSTPDWRSVLLPPERDAAASARPPGESAARPGGPGGTSSSQVAAAAQGTGPRGTGSPGMHPPMMGGGAGGSQGEDRRRASYLIDDSDAFVDKRWFSEPVITPDDPL